MLSTIKKLLGSRPANSTVAELEGALRKMDGLLDKARSALAVAEAERGHAVLNGESAENRKATAQAQDNIASIEAARTILLERLDAARQAEADAERLKRYDRAKAAEARAIDAALDELPKHIANHLRLIRVFEEARAQAVAVNDDLPPGCDALSDPEAKIRDRAGLPAELISEVRRTVWSRVDLYPGEEIEPGKVRSFQEIGHGLGQFVETKKGVDHFIPCVGRIEITRKTRVAEMGELGARLRNVAMPGLRWHDPSYKPVPWPNPTFDDVSRAVDRAEEVRPEPASEERYVRTEVTSEPLT